MLGVNLPTDLFTTNPWKCTRTSVIKKSATNRVSYSKILSETKVSLRYVDKLTGFHRHILCRLLCTANVTCLQWVAVCATSSNGPQSSCLQAKDRLTLARKSITKGSVDNRSYNICKVSPRSRIRDLEQ